MSMEKLGQHFLKNKSALRLIAESLELTPDDVVIEIGPGHGELTDFLQIVNDKSRIILIEKDERLFDFLKEKFKGGDRMAVVRGDALKTLPDIIQNSKFKILDYKLVGNIPYYITGHLFRIMSELTHKPERCVFTIQKEVADRMCATPPRMNRLAASVQFWAKIKAIKILPASDFHPQPKVSSAIIVLEKMEATDIGHESYYAAVRALFAQPRKTLANNLAAATGQKRAEVAAKLSAIGMLPTNRPQNLAINEIIVIAKTFFNSW